VSEESRRAEFLNLKARARIDRVDTDEAGCPHRFAIVAVAQQDVAGVGIELVEFLPDISGQVLVAALNTINLMPQSKNFAKLNRSINYLDIEVT
jgi:hypothetical protein